MEETLGKRIVQNRKRMGMTQDQLAERLGVTPQAVSKWENDQSCPDITMLPRLAAIFGISTDQLLGLDPQEEATAHQAEVIVEDASGEGASGKWEFKYDSGRMGTLSLAVWVLLVGAQLLAAGVLDWEVGFWDLLWPNALLVFGLFGLIRKFSFFSLGCTLFGGYFLLENLNIPVLHIGKELLLPITLLIFGLSLLVDALRKKNKPQFQVFHNGRKVCRGNIPGESSASRHCHQQGETFGCDISFASDHQKIHLPRVRRGDISSSFGELTVDLTGCGEFAPDCYIEVSCSFGNVTLLVPRTCRVDADNSTAFGSVEIQGAPDAEAQAAIQMECNASFGNIILRYV